MTSNIDLKALLGEGLEALNKYNVMAVPGILADLAVIPIVMAVGDPFEDLRLLVLLVLANMSFSFFAFGLTLGMAREYIESGKTSLKTAAFIAQRLAPTLIALSLLCPLVLMTGMVIYVVPGLVAGCFMLFAMPAVIARGLGPYDALVRSIDMARDNLAASVRVYATIVLTAMVFGFVGFMLAAIPVLGLILNLVLQGAYMAIMSMVLYRVYRMLEKPGPGKAPTPEQ